MNIKKYLLSGIAFQMPDSGGGPAPSSSSPSGSPSGGSEASATPFSAAPAPAVPSGSPTPESSPQGPSSAEPSSPSEEVVDFSMIFGDGPEPIVAQPQPPAAAPQAPQAPAQPAPAPAATPAATAPKGPDAPAVPAAPAPTEAASAPAAQLDPYDPGALATALLESEAQAVQHLSDTMFKLSPEEIEELESNTVTMVPKLLAKTLVRAQHSTLQTLSRLIPAMIQRQTAVLKRHMENEQAFYGRWPDLKPDQHAKLVNDYAAVFRRMNPTMTTQEMIEKVGPMVMMAAGITPTAQPQGVPQARVPASPMAPSGVRPQPFTPAGPLAGGPAASTPIEQSAIEAMFDPNQG